MTRLFVVFLFLRICFGGADDANAKGPLSALRRLQGRQDQSNSEIPVAAASSQVGGGQSMRGKGGPGQGGKSDTTETGVPQPLPSEGAGGQSMSGQGGPEQGGGQSNTAGTGVPAPSPSEGTGSQSMSGKGGLEQSGKSSKTGKGVPTPSRSNGADGQSMSGNQSMSGKGGLEESGKSSKIGKGGSTRSRTKGSSGQSMSGKHGQSKSGKSDHKGAGNQSMSGNDGQSMSGNSGQLTPSPSKGAGGQSTSGKGGQSMSGNSGKGGQGLPSPSPSEGGSGGSMKGKGSTKMGGKSGKSSKTGKSSKSDTLVDDFFWGGGNKKTGKSGKSVDTRQSGKSGKSGAAAPSIDVALACEVLKVAAPEMDEISSQQAFEFFAEEVRTRDCRVPKWRTWVLVPLKQKGDNGDKRNPVVVKTLRTKGNKADEEAIWISPDKVFAGEDTPPGAYRIRLVRSDEQDVLLSNYPIVDSARFFVDAPPAGGSLQIDPPVGSAITTKFMIRSTGWIDDDDAPLQHRISFARNKDDSSALKWIFLGSWSHKNDVAQTLLPAAGNYTIRVEVKDRLGTIVRRSSSLEVNDDRSLSGNRTAGATSSNDLMGFVNMFSGDGSSEAMAGAVAMVAGIAAEGNVAEEESQQLAMQLWTELSNANLAGQAASAETLLGVADAVNGILTLAGSESMIGAEGNATSPEDIVESDLELANDMTNLVLQAATSAQALEAGLDIEDGGSFLGAISGLFASIDSIGTVAARRLAELGDQDGEPSFNESNLTQDGDSGFNESNLTQERYFGNSSKIEKIGKVGRAMQRASSQLQSATSAVGDAVGKSLKPGQEALLHTENGMVMKVGQMSPTGLMEEGYHEEAGGLAVPPMPDLEIDEGPSATIDSKRRRLSDCGSVSVQRTKWPRNPFSFAGTKAGANAGEMRSMIGSIEQGARSARSFENEKCCSVVPTSVERTEVRACGASAIVKNLAVSNSINFTIWARRDAEDVNWTNSVTGRVYLRQSVRVCQYWDEQEEQWSSAGCWVSASTDDYLNCSCTHLTNFAIAGGSISVAFDGEDDVEKVYCSQATLFHTEGIGSSFFIDTSKRWHASVFMVFVAMEIILLVLAIHHDGRLATDGLLDDNFFLFDDTILFQDLNLGAPDDEDLHRRGIDGVLSLVGLNGRFMSEAFKHQDSAGNRSSEPCVMRLVAGILASVLLRASSFTLGFLSEDAQLVIDSHKAEFLETVSDARIVALKQQGKFLGAVTSFLRRRMLGAKALKYVDGAGSGGDLLAKHLASQTDNLTLFNPFRRFLRLNGIIFRFAVSSSILPTLMHFTVFIPTGTKVLLWTTQVMAVSVISAFFYSKTTALSADSSALCSAVVVGSASWFRTAWLYGVFGLIGSSVLVALFERMHLRRMRPFAGEKERHSILTVWRLKSIIMWGALPVMNCAGAMYILLFLSNIRSEDASAWITSASLGMLQQNIFTPLVIYGAAMMLSSLVFMNPLISRDKKRRIVALTADILGCGPNFAASNKKAREEQKEPKVSQRSLEKRASRGGADFDRSIIPTSPRTLDVEDMADGEKAAHCAPKAKKLMIDGVKPLWASRSKIGHVAVIWRKDRDWVAVWLRQSGSKHWKPKCSAKPMMYRKQGLEVEEVHKQVSKAMIDVAKRFAEAQIAEGQLDKARDSILQKRGIELIEEDAPVAEGAEDPNEGLMSKEERRQESLHPEVALLGTLPKRSDHAAADEVVPSKVSTRSSADEGHSSTQRKRSATRSRSAGKGTEDGGKVKSTRSLPTSKDARALGATRSCSSSKGAEDGGEVKVTRSQPSSRIQGSGTGHMRSNSKDTRAFEATHSCSARKGADGGGQVSGSSRSRPSSKSQGCSRDNTVKRGNSSRSVRAVRSDSSDARPKHSG